MNEPPAGCPSTLVRHWFPYFCYGRKSGHEPCVCLSTML